MAKLEAPTAPKAPSGRWEVVHAEDARAYMERRLTGLDVRSEHRILQGLSEEDLTGMPLVPEGQTLRRYAEYLDLHDPGRANFLAEGNESVRPGQRLVARKTVSKEIWDDLRSACDEIVGRRARRTA